ncbi:2-keto-4-pentenoate hydratase [Collimonas sp. PA-H2]|uniref:2-keto-4-pentenoate hydratase n=1 Tax=Collimonas sp. PA-H2 TaxID=1881062 RepID=UPI000C00C742|nr:2-keto-4-pentenoate hydratase [Collimonas sp. PA-H2]PFH09774.1 2-keto-4-pentenoate hydratase [Collimonas sp. PA-H2]
MISLDTPQAGLAAMLSKAYGERALLECLPAALEPASSEQAYQVQREFLHHRQASIGGWKIGAKSPTGPIQGAPLPAGGIVPTTSTIDRADYPVLGIELEIMFCFKRDIDPGAAPLSDVQVMHSIGTMAASIEIVSSRIAGWPELPKLLQLADLQNHGALITGEFIDYDASFPFASPAAHLTLGGRDIFKGSGSNPAGDPRRLLGWLVQHCRAQGIAIPCGTVITTGSYTGIHFPEEAGLVIGQIASLPPIHFELR